MNRKAPELFDLTGHVAVITGGGRGIGEGIAKSFSDAGAAVVVAARRTNEIERVASEIRDAGGEVIAVTTDVTDTEAVEELARAAVSEFGRLTVWVNNAGGSSVHSPLVELESDHFLLELFHGPTLAFKDFAMQLIGQFFQVALGRKKSRVTIVGATSGDTGSAAIEAFRGLDAVDVFILYPDGRVSDVQRRQMTTPSENNVHAIAINGHFDDCQARLKDMFNDFEFRDGVNLAGVNSINWARVLAQVVYYFSSAVKLGAPNKKISFSVPTGNFGDIFAGFIAKKMGLSIDRLVIATNQNDILHRCISSGVYKTDKVLPSISPSMDIQVSSNFERAFFYATECDGSEVSNLMEQLKSTGKFTVSGSVLEILQENFDSGRASEDETHSEIAYNYQKHSELLCPHSAIGVLTARKQRKIGIPMVTLATAHPAKFPTAVKNATFIILYN